MASRTQYLMLLMLMTTRSFLFLGFVAVISLSLLHLFAPCGSATLLHLNGNWSTPFGDDESPWIMGQAYNLSLSHDPTAAITINGNVRYATREQQGTEKTTTLAPSAAISLSNDLFRFNLSGSLSTQQQGKNPSTINRNWNSNISTNYVNPLWPQLRLNYGESNSTIDTSPTTIDLDTKNFAGSIDYGWRFIKLRYNYRNSRNIDQINNSEIQTTGHAANIYMAKTLLDNRLALNASYQFAINSSEASYPGSSSKPIIDLIASAAYAGIDNTPATGTQLIAPALNDQNLQTATSIGLPGIGDHLNLVLQNNLQTFTRLNLFFDRTLTTSTLQRLHWSFYTSQDNNTWVPLTIIPVIDYPAESNGNTRVRIIFPIPITTVRYIKVVVETDPGFNTAFFTEFSAQEEIEKGKNTSTSDYTTENIQASINYNPWQPLQLGYSFSRNIADSDRSVLSTQDNHTISSHLNLNRYFMLSLSLNENIDIIEGLDTNRNRSYACSYQATLLDNMNFSLNGTRSDHFNGGKKDRTADSLSTSLSTVIVPDLTANLSYQWSKSINFVDASEARTNSYTFNLMARVNPRLNFSYFYSHSETSTHNVSILYHPSELLSFTASTILTNTTKSYSTALNWRLTRKIQADLNYLISINNDDTSHGSRLNLSWNISSFLSVRQNIAWSKNDTTDSWTGLLSISYNF